MVPLSFAINKERYSDEMKLFLLVSSFFVVSFGARNQCSDFNADIAILLDASDDTGEVAFNQQKQFAQSLTKWLPRVGTNCKVKVVPYSWTIDRPLVDFSKDASRWQQNNILSKANYAQRKGPRRPMVRIAKDLIEKHFRPSETRRDAKQIAIVVTSETTKPTRKNIAKSFFNGIPDDQVPFLIVIGVGQTDSIKHLMKLAENPCHVLTVPAFDKLSMSMPIVKQRLCEIMTSGQANPKGNTSSLFFHLYS